MTDLGRFIEAQDPIYERALDELRSGRKRSHWMWFVFPQIAGLGFSATSVRYGIRDAQEAQAYSNDAVLGSRLRECIRTVMQHPEKSAREIFGRPDDLKFRSCLTLFREVEPAEPIFQKALDLFFDGNPDPRTLEILQV